MIAHPCYKFAPMKKAQQAKQDEQLPNLSHSGTSDSVPALDQDHAECLMESGDGSVPLSPLQHGLPMITHPNSTWPTKSPSNQSSEKVQAGNKLYHYLQPNNSQHPKGCHIVDGLPAVSNCKVLGALHQQFGWDRQKLPTMITCCRNHLF